MSKLKYVVKTVGKEDASALVSLPTAISKFDNAIQALRPFADGSLLFSFEDNDWESAERLLPTTIISKARARLKNAKVPGIDVFVKGRRSPMLRQSPVIRIRSAEQMDPAAKFEYSGEISPALRKLADAVWAEFGSNKSLHNLGVHVCRKIAGSSSWSQHSWDDAIDIGIGSDMKLGDDIYRFLKKNEGKFGPYYETIWREPSHWDHLHWSLAPAHTGTPPCA